MTSLKTSIKTITYLSDIGCLEIQGARCCLRFRLCRSIRCVYRLLITCSFPFRRDSYSGQPSVIHITTSKGDSRLIRRPSVAIVRSPNTCATTVFRSLSYA